MTRLIERHRGDALRRFRTARVVLAPVAGARGPAGKAHRPDPWFVSRPSGTGPPTRRSPARRGAFVALAAALTIPLAVLAAPSALAADGPYNIDGDVPDAGTTELPTRSGT